MIPRILLFILLCHVSVAGLFSQISNTATYIKLESISFPPSRVCPWNDVPPSSAGHVYQMYIEYADGDNSGAPGRMPTSGYYNCTVTNTPNSYGPSIGITVPGASFPTPANTALGWDLVQTTGVVVLKNLTTNTEYHQSWEYDQYVCNALPIFISSFTVNSNYQSTNYLKFDWTAEDESDYLSHYILQKSTNNFQWTNELLEPANTGLGTHYYTVYANKPGASQVWYRLKWINDDGYARHSQPIQVTNSGSATSIVCNYAYITGVDSFCAPQSQVYKLHNAPASGAVYSWSVTGGSVTSTEQNGLKATVSFSNAANATVYANSANSSCNKSKAVTVGGTGTVTINGEYSPQASYTYFYLSINSPWPGTSPSQYQWYSNGNYLGTASYWEFYVYPDSCLNVEVKVLTPCGWVTGFNYLCHGEGPLCGGANCEPCYPCDGRRIPDKFKVMPVPANDVLTVHRLGNSQLNNHIGGKTRKTTTVTDVYTLQLFDMFGNLKLERKNVSLKVDQRLDVRHLPVGNYILYIQNAATRVSKQIRIQR